MAVVRDRKAYNAFLQNVLDKNGKGAADVMPANERNRIHQEMRTKTLKKRAKGK